MRTWCARRRPEAHGRAADIVPIGLLDALHNFVTTELPIFGSIRAAKSGCGGCRWLLWPVEFEELAASGVAADRQAMDAERGFAEDDDRSGVEVVDNDLEVVQDERRLFSRPLIRRPAHEQQGRCRRA